MPRRFRLPRLRKGRSKKSGLDGSDEPTPKVLPPITREDEPPEPSESPEPPEPPRPPRDLWFRFVTRVQAVGYWLREKAQIAWRVLGRGAADAVEFWRTRSPGTKHRTYAVAAVVALYLLIRLAPIPGVPCQVSAAKECAPPDETIAFVPENALLYGHFTIDSDSHQYELARDLSEDLPDATLLSSQIAAAVPTPSGNPIDIGADILPWAKRDLALILVPGPAKTALPVFVAGVDDRQGAEEFIATVAPPGAAQPSDQQGSELSVHPAGFASAFAGDELLFGNESAVRIALDAEAGRVPGLEGSGNDAAREELPDVRFAEVYLSRPGVQRLLVGRGPGATQLDTFVDYGATSGMAASMRVRDDGIEVNLASRLDEELLGQSPTVFAELPEFEPDLANEAGDRALAYIGVGEVGPTLAEVLSTAGAGAQGLTGSLQALAQNLRQRAGVDPLSDLLPALGGQAALVAEPTDAVPFASLIVDGVDEEEAKEALARLQGPLVKALGTQAGAVAKFRTTEEDGVEVNSVRVSPTVDLTYAVFDGKLVVSTDPAGIAQVRADGGLGGTESYESVVDRLPGEVSALVFLNLDELLGLAEQAGLAEDPLYASLSDDISKIPSMGLAVNGSTDQIRSELFLSLD